MVVVVVVWSYASPVLLLFFLVSFSLEGSSADVCTSNLRSLEPE